MSSSLDDKLRVPDSFSNMNHLIPSSLIYASKTAFIPHVPQSILNPTTLLISYSHFTAPINIRKKYKIPLETLLIIKPSDTSSHTKHENKNVIICTPTNEHFKINPLDYVKGCLEMGADIIVSLNDYTSSSTSTLNHPNTIARNIQFFKQQTDYLTAIGSIVKIYACLCGREDENDMLILDKADGFVLLDLKDAQFTSIKPVIYSPKSITEIEECKRLGVIMDTSFVTDLTSELKCLGYLGIKNVKEEESWIDKKEKLLLGCECWTCERHTKAYVYHLATLNEITASTLLMIHNLEIMRLLVLR